VSKFILHNATVVQSEFLQRDDDGNIVDRKQVQSTINALTKDEFIKLFEMLVEFRDDWESKCQPD